MKDIIYSLGEKQRIMLLIDLIVQNPECAKKIFNVFPSCTVRTEYKGVQPLIDFIMNEETSSDPSLYMLQLSAVHSSIKDECINRMLLFSIERRTEFLSQNVPYI